MSENKITFISFAAALVVSIIAEMLSHALSLNTGEIIAVVALVVAVNTFLGTLDLRDRNK